MNRKIALLCIFMSFLISSCTTEGSKDATLKSIQVSSGTLDPTFASEKTEYAIAVNSGLLTLTPTTSHPTSYLAAKINDQPYTLVSNGDSIEVPLEIGENTVLLKVTAQDGVTDKVYTFAIDATPVFTFGGFDSNAVSSGLTIKNTSSSDKTVTGFYMTSLDVGDSHPCFGSIVGGTNLFGALWSPIVVPAHQKVSLDQNYLYNAMAHFLYQTTFIVGLVPFDTPGATSSWCISIGLASAEPIAQLMNDATASPMTHNSISGIASEEVVISCDDTTFTCSATPANEQLFPR